MAAYARPSFHVTSTREPGGRACMGRSFSARGCPIGRLSLDGDTGGPAPPRRDRARDRARRVDAPSRRAACARLRAQGCPASRPPPAEGPRAQIFAHQTAPASRPSLAGEPEARSVRDGPPRTRPSPRFPLVRTQRRPTVRRSIARLAGPPAPRRRPAGPSGKPAAGRSRLRPAAPARRPRARARTRARWGRCEAQRPVLR